MEDLCAIYSPTKRLRKDNCKSRGSGICAKDPLSDIPAKLVAIAEQQIIRGTQEEGIVGNITSVAAARSLIYRTFSGSGVLPDDWETRVDISAAFPLKTDTLPNCFCPSCYSPI